MSVPEGLQGLDLVPHPEGGWYRETWRSEHCTVIDFALEPGSFSSWHRVRGADEVWTHVRGLPLGLHILLPDGRYERTVLGPDHPSAVVPADAWQAAEPLGDAFQYALVTCTVSPPFAFERFDLADATLADAWPQYRTILERLTRV